MPARNYDFSRPDDIRKRSRRVSRVQSGEKVLFQNCSLGCACTARGGRNCRFQKIIRFLKLTCLLLILLICAARARIELVAPTDVGPCLGFYFFSYPGHWVGGTSRIVPRTPRPQLAPRQRRRTTEYTRPVATGDFVKTIFSHNFPKNDAQDLEKWSRKTRLVFLYNL